MAGALGWPASLLFGSLIAATDPVSVIAMMKEQECRQASALPDGGRKPDRWRGSGVFALVADWIMGSATGLKAIATALLTTVGGGVLLGLGQRRG
jgi:CPA1 family monovalent cation:H+ antiporter